MGKDGIYYEIYSGKKEKDNHILENAKNGLILEDEYDFGQVKFADSTIDQNRMASLQKTRLGQSDNRGLSI